VSTRVLVRALLFRAPRCRRRLIFSRAHRAAPAPARRSMHMAASPLASARTRTVYCRPELAFVLRSSPCMLLCNVCVHTYASWSAAAPRGKKKSEVHFAKCASLVTRSAAACLQRIASTIVAAGGGEGPAAVAVVADFLQVRELTPARLFPPAAPHLALGLGPDQEAVVGALPRLPLRALPLPKSNRIPHFRRRRRRRRRLRLSSDSGEHYYCTAPTHMAMHALD
jgi:hypothetical protein